MSGSTVAAMILAVVAVLSCASLTSSESYISENARSVSAGINQFAVNFYQSVVKHVEHKNLIVSPLSASIVLSMLSYGAEGDTLERLRKALCMPVDRSIVLRGYNDLINAYNGQTDVTIELANKILYPKDLTVYQKFFNLNSFVFHSELTEFDPSYAADVVETINNWVSAKTHQKIKDIVNTRDISTQVGLILLNAMYFKGEWAMIVNEENTANKPFYIDEQTVVDVPTMRVPGSFITGSVPELEAVFFALPYKGEEFNMVFLVPEKPNGLGLIEKNLSQLNLTKLMNYDRSTIVVCLPKFKIESDVKLERPLQEMGFDDLFKDTVYTHISPSSLQVNSVRQKSLIEINEKGSEAVSASVMLMDRSFADIIYVDKPSLFLIAKGDSVLFVGRIVDPSKS